MTTARCILYSVIYSILYVKDYAELVREVELQDHIAFDYICTGIKPDNERGQHEMVRL